MSFDLCSLCSFKISHSRQHCSDSLWPWPQIAPLKVMKGEIHRCGPKKMRKSLSTSFIHLSTHSPFLYCYIPSLGTTNGSLFPSTLILKRKKNTFLYSGNGALASQKRRNGGKNTTERLEHKLSSASVAHGNKHPRGDCTVKWS